MTKYWINSIFNFICNITFYLYSLFILLPPKLLILVQGWWLCSTFDTRTQLERHRKDKHGPTEACPHCRYVVPKSRPYLIRNHLERVHRIHHHVQPDTIWKPPTVPSPAVPAFVSASVSPNVPSVSSPVPSPDHGSRSQLTPLRPQVLPSPWSL